MQTFLEQPIKLSDVGAWLYPISHIVALAGRSIALAGNLPPILRRPLNVGLSCITAPPRRSVAAGFAPTPSE
jgi:hypothetical protein